MPASGTGIFTDCGEYQASLDNMLDLLVMQPREFRARLTRVQLPTLRLFCAHEASPRVAYVSLPPERVFVTFPTRRGPPLFCDGVEMRFGDIMFHSRGERLHQRTTTASRWGSISLERAALMAFARTLAGREIVPPPVGLILRAPSADRTRMLRLHAQACRITETNLNRIDHQEVARALEQDLIWALTTCLTGSVSQDDPGASRVDSKILRRFEDVQRANPYELLPVAEICSVIGVSAQTLGASCANVLGMTPHRYLNLRRLSNVRAALLRSDTVTVTVAEVTQRYGFGRPHDFVAEYLKAFGEMPLTFPPGAAGEDD
jgi:AraC-like DNA-binding protein